MYEYDNLMDFFLDNFKKVFYPEEWIGLDLTLSKTEIFVLLLLDRHDEVIMSQIADYINIPMSTATGIVDRLVKKGHVKRERSDADRRIVLLRLTEKGKELLQGFKTSVNKYLELINEGLTEEEKNLLIKLALKVIKLFEKDAAPGDQDTAGSGTVKRIEIE
ncbi:MAG: MarR family transcriptional regulator [Bacillota bacterium]